MTICLVGSSFCLSEYRPPNELRHHPRKNNLKQKHAKKSFPIRLALIHRLKSRMIPFKDAKNHIKNCSQKFMDIITLFIMPISYIAFKDFV